MGRKSDAASTDPKTVVVIGGGLAGLAAARSLTSYGYAVTLIEKRPFLGGRAFSFNDAEVGCEVDNGQHVFLGCCSYYLDLLRDIGTVDKTFLQSSLRVEVVRNGRRGVLSSVPALGPLHLLPSFVRYPHLGLLDKLRAAYGLLRIKLTDRRKGLDRLDGQTLYQWMKNNLQSERAIDNLWNLIILPALNDDVRDVSANMGLMVLQEGLVKRPGDAAIGYSRVGLTSLTGDPAARFIEERGGTVLLGKSVRSVRIEGDEATAVELADGSEVRADAYVSALPFDILPKVLPRDVAESPFFARLSGLASSPIVGVHLWYDRPVIDSDFIAVLDSPVQWVFNKSTISGAGSEGGQYVCISVSGAWDFVNRPKEALRELFVGEMARIFPEAGSARVERFLIVKQPWATFRSVPGAADYRPPQETPIRNLFIAGDWTETDWPSTMEGAVRSGVFAAEKLATAI